MATQQLIRDLWTVGYPATVLIQHIAPPSGNTSTAPSQRAHPSVPRTHQSAVCPPLQGPQASPKTQHDQGPEVSGSRHTVQGTKAQDNREAGRTAVRQREDRPREPTLHEALAGILGAYHHSQETMGQIPYKLQETQRLQEGQYLGISEDLKHIHITLVTIAGVLADIGNTMREAVEHQRAPETSHTDEQPSTGTSGQEALPQDQQTTITPPPAEGEPPCKQSLRSRQKPENIAKTPPGNKTLLNVTLVSHSVTLSTLSCHCSTSYAPLGNAPVIQIEQTLSWAFLLHQPSPLHIPIYFSALK
ncbi:hypothetical protein NDU88_003114 [Pleurodeles waltl]|uniref:Uncharacterized protein n=1 Tax=Pleurodeles waltl TaxID=8319 RepID=A0AAV7L0X9_PLEWA|nr:hypothetical protein NDU88_003114 [Pleurodeles waltl]